MKKLILLLCLPLLATHLRASTFISDKAYKAKVESTFQKRMKLIGTQFFNPGPTADSEENEILKFLYAYMPLADITDYTTAFHLTNVRVTLQAQREMPWGKQVPQLLFRHFVLPLRVNNENLDSSRTVFYRELKERVRHLSMKDAILEVNHWCHEHVTYHPSDGRTMSPLACYHNGLGRCGEESTFAVAALRAVGIPARQVYTPRWAHTDDNHAWVEAWADGRWWFLGACEPEPVLNLGWFNEPASRALLMHTKVFGDYNGPEEVVLRTPAFTEINLIDNYAQTARADFRVVDTQGRPVQDAKVEFRIYNYAEFYPAVTKYTDHQGHTYLTAGLGEMIVWASKNGKFGVKKVTFGKDRNIDITLREGGNWADYARLSLTPPASHPQMPNVSDSMRKANNLRFASEDSIRKTHEQLTFYNGETTTELGKMLKTARSNWKTIQQFASRHQGNSNARAMQILRSISEKDLRDMPMTILEDQFSARSSQLCPRVEDEMITAPFKCILQDVFAQKVADSFRKDPSKLVEWVKTNIRPYPIKDVLNIPQTPIGVWRSRMADERSRDIFFVDLARSLDIEARKDVVTGKLQYQQNGKWVDVVFGGSMPKAAPSGTLKLTYKPTQLLPNPKYYYNFTISRLDNGTSALLNYNEAADSSGEEADWKNTFANGVPMETGHYLLVGGTRMASGKVEVFTKEFSVMEGKTTTTALAFPIVEDEPTVIGSFNSESTFTHGGKAVSILSQTGRGYFIVGVVAPGEEPTSHALRDIVKMKAGIDAWQRPLILLFSSESDLQRYQKEDYGTMPERTILGVDTDGSILRQITEGMKMHSSTQRPVFIIADTFNRVVFSSQGYTIGLGEQLLKAVNKLK